MRSVVTDRLAWSVGQSVGLSVTIASPENVAEPIEMPFGLWARACLGNHVLDGGPDPHGKGQFRGRKGGDPLP